MPAGSMQRSWREAVLLRPHLGYNVPAGQGSPAVPCLIVTLHESKSMSRTGRWITSRVPYTRCRAAVALALAGVTISACADESRPPVSRGSRGLSSAQLDSTLLNKFVGLELDGRIEETLEARLGRPVNPQLAEVGRLLFFDPVLSLTRDNSCSGCHGPNVSFNDSQPIAIGIGNNGVVGPGRMGPRNLRRAPTVINAAFFPKLMWDSRFKSHSLDPFDNSSGFEFPEPEGSSLSGMDHLLAAQAFTPVVAREEMAGFQFQGDNDSIRAVIERRVDDISQYREMFAEVYPEIASGESIRYRHIGEALAEFQFTLIRANSPLDEYARGDTSALSLQEKEGALIFFSTEGTCFECHITHGFSNQMFSNFETQVLAVPQIVPLATNVAFDGPAANEDYGEERSTGNPEHRYRFRPSPLRNVALQPSFMHNGAFVCMEDAVRHHMEMLASLERFDVGTLEPALRGTPGPWEPMVAVAHEISIDGVRLTDEGFEQLMVFLRNSLTDPDARPEQLRHLIPDEVPSGLPVHQFDFSAAPPNCS